MLRGLGKFGEFGKKCGCKQDWCFCTSVFTVGKGIISFFQIHQFSSVVIIVVKCIA